MDEKNKGGRPQSVSKTISEDELESEVRGLNSGGGYIPVPKSWAGERVKIIKIKKEK